MAGVHDAAKGQQQAMLDTMRDLVNIESGSKDVEGVELNWTVAQAGTNRNVIPGQATAQADARALKARGPVIEGMGLSGFGAHSNEISRPPSTTTYVPQGRAGRPRGTGASNSSEPPAPPSTKPKQPPSPQRRSKPSPPRAAAGPWRPEERKQPPEQSILPPCPKEPQTLQKK